MSCGIADAAAQEVHKGVMPGERYVVVSVCRGFGEEAASYQLAVALNGIEMDMQTRIGGELLELLCEANEDFLMTQLFGEQLLEGGQE